MLKKLKQKKQLYFAFLIAIIGVNLLGFFPSFVNAQSSTVCSFNPAAPKSYKSRIYVDKADGLADRFFGVNEANVKTRSTKPLNSNEDIIFYAEVAIPADQAEACKSKVYELGIWGYAGLASLNRIRVTAAKQTVNNELHLFWKFTVNASNIGRLPESPDQTMAYVYACEANKCPSTDIGGSSYIEGVNMLWRQTNADPQQSTPPSSPLLESNGDTGGGTNLDNPVDFSTIKTKITPNQNGNGLRQKYRVLWSDNSLDFGRTQGLDGIHMEWASDPVAVGTYFSLPHKDDNWGITFTPYYGGSTVYFGDYQKLSSTSTIACKPGWTYTDCSNVVFSSTNPSSSTNYNKGIESPIIPVPNDFNPSLLKAAWQSKVTQPTSQQLQNGNNGKPLGTVDFGAIPALIGFKFGSQTILNPRNWIIDDTVIVLSGGGNLQKVTVEVYANNADIIAACKADSTVTDKSKCDDINFAKYRSGGTVSQTTNPTENKAPTTLFGFILEIIAYIVVAITSVIYWIFSYVLVPVLNALIRIHPYRDTFVNVVYPGWLIMRNLANIAFIIALLVMGLRTLFQMGGDKVRSFIVWLILMALLVNFSLVIAQAVVAIADTVQSQFLPGNTQVIEALGKALMADPAIAFQTKISGIEDGSATASLFTPIMLLITSVAGFFAFLAITAFVAIRTVMLWVFYLTSPFAYFGQVLDQTRGIAKQWWTEFLKYAFMVPILAFFLNIAALMAGTLGRTVNPQAASGLFTDQAIAGVEGVTLTIISQAVVLLFLFAGMQVALRSGTIGSKAVVKYAQQGFKNALTKWPNSLKDTGLNLGSKSLEKLGFNKTAKVLTAAGKPLTFGKAAYKTQVTDRADKRDKELKDRLGNTFLTRSKEDTSKLGSSLKGAKERAKDLSDNVDELKDVMASGYKKGLNNDLKKDLTGSLYKMGQEGKFKEMLEHAGELSGGDKDKYSKDAAGLNAMTEDMVKQGKISKDERRDLLNSFNQFAKKNKANAHYSGNMEYNKDSKKMEPRKLDPNTDDGFARADANPYKDENSWTNVQIKSRGGQDAKGSLKTDLTNAHKDAAVNKKTGELTDVQVGLFAHESIANLSDNRIWDAAHRGAQDKMDAIRKAMDKPEKVGRVRERMIQYYTAKGDSVEDATAQAEERINILQNQLLERQDGGNQNQGGGNGRQIGITADRIAQEQGGQNQQQGSDEDEEDDDEPQASTARTTVVNASGPTINSTASQINTENRMHSDEVLNPIGDQVFGSQTTGLTRGSASINNSGKGSGTDKPRRRAGFTGDVGRIKTSNDQSNSPSESRDTSNPLNFSGKPSDTEKKDEAAAKDQETKPDDTKPKPE